MKPVWKYPMDDAMEGSKKATSGNRRVYLANERTFLAWIRTSIGIMAFGFVVERFALFMKQFSYLIGTAAETSHLQEGHSYSWIFGIVLIGFGVLIAVLSFIRYKKREQQIEENTFDTSSSLALVLVLSVTLAGIVLIIFILRSI